MMRFVPLLALVLMVACGDDGQAGVDAGSADATPAANMCPPAEALAVIDEHISQLGGAAEMLAGHSGPTEATGFFLFPGLQSGVLALFAGPLVMTCSSPMSYDEYCEAPYCSQIECTGQGAGWIYHFRLSPAPLVSGDFTLAEATMDNAWSDGDSGTDFTIGATVNGPGGTDYSFTGHGRMAMDALELTETYGKLVEAGDLTVTFHESATAHSGEAKVGGTTVATADPTTGKLTLTGPCQ